MEEKNKVFAMNTLFFLSNSVGCSYQALISKDGLACHETKDGCDEGEASDNRKVLIGFALMDECRQQDVPREVYQNRDQTELSLKETLLIYKYGVEAEGRG
jgi:hypothetical protein